MPSKKEKEVIKFHVEGLKELDADLKRMSLDLQTRAGANAVRSTMMPVAGDVRANVPVDQRDLKDSVRIHPKRPERSADKRGVWADVRAGVPGPRTRYKRTGRKRPVYALQVEYGTEDTPEQPFMRPAMDGKVPEILGRFKRLLNNQIIRWKIKDKP